MPIYAYSCRDCGGAFDIRQEFSDPTLTVCEACGGRLRKQFGSIGVTFNGPGFYRTDSRGSSSTTSSKSSSISGSTSDAKSTGDSKSTSTSPASTSSGAA